jgi:hypothetical protein
MVKGGEIDLNTMVENMMTFTGAGYEISFLYQSHRIHRDVLTK